MAGEIESTLTSQARLGAELRRVRVEVLALTQDQMATRLGLGVYSQGRRRTSTARASVSLMELGRRRPSPDVLGIYLEMTDQPERLRRYATLEQPNDDSGAGTQSDCAGGSTPQQQTDTATSHIGATQSGRANRRRPSRAVVIAGVALVVVAVTAVVSFDRRHETHGPTTTYTETTGTPAHTWSDPAQASGIAGVPLGPRQSVQVSCRTKGYVVPDGDPWWYRLESLPWNGDFYATSDAFYNQGSTSGPVVNGVVVDEQLPLC